VAPGARVARGRSDGRSAGGELPQDACTLAAVLVCRGNAEGGLVGGLSWFIMVYHAANFDVFDLLSRLGIGHETHESG